MLPALLIDQSLNIIYSNLFITYLNNSSSLLLPNFRLEENISPFVFKILKVLKELVIISTNQTYLIYCFFMRSNHRLGLICQDKSFRDEFLAKVFKNFQGSSPLLSREEFQGFSE